MYMYIASVRACVCVEKKKYSEKINHPVSFCWLKGFDSTDNSVDLFLDW